jgi:hypothetical protein
VLREAVKTEKNEDDKLNWRAVRREPFSFLMPATRRENQPITPPKWDGQTLKALGKAFLKLSLPSEKKRETAGHTVTAPWTHRCGHGESREAAHRICNPLPHFTSFPQALSPARVVLSYEGRLTRHAPKATAWFVGQARYALLHKPLHPFVDKAAADANRVGDVGDRDPVSEE